jgi:glutathione S-transferase
VSYTLFAHPFSSYCWKVLIALYEKDLPFAYRVVGDAEAGAALRRHWPIGTFPVLIDGDGEDGVPVIESTSIIEYLDLRHDQHAPLFPTNAIDALDVRFMDRIFDNHVMTPMNAVVAEYLLDREHPDQARIDKACAALDTIYAWLDVRLAGRSWASSHGFSLADCTAAPSLFYADWVRPIPERFADLRAYRARLLARPSVSRCVEEARPFRSYFPPGAPDRD